MKRWMAVGTVGALVGATLLVTGQAGARQKQQDQVGAVLRDPTGAAVGVVSFASTGRGTLVTAVLQPNRYVRPGAFHGFHVHANNDPSNGTGCVADPKQPASTWFVSADAHLAHGGQVHGDHDGDLPSPLVLPDGTAVLSVTTDRFGTADVAGKAVVLHAMPDNFGNVPMGDAAEAFIPNSQAALDRLLRTGDSGDRVACGVIRKR
jgi:Cu-Zn family superoxide dismutase